MLCYAGVFALLQKHTSTTLSTDEHGLFGYKLLTEMRHVGQGNTCIVKLSLHSITAFVNVKRSLEAGVESNLFWEARILRATDMILLILL